MEETRNSDRDARTSLKSEQSAAEKIVRDAEMHSSASPERQPVRETTSSYLGMKRKEAPPAAGEGTVADEAREGSTAPVGDSPAPLSAALGIPTLMNEAEASTEEQGRKGTSWDKAEPGEGESRVAKSGAYVSSGLGLPLLSENPTPLSSALHIPTLLNESKPSPER